MSKKVLIVVGVLLVLMGIAGLIPAWTWASMPQWYAILKIVIGLICIYVSKTDR